MQKLAELCVRRPVFASVIILILVVVGFVSFTRLGVDRFPEVEFPTVVVVTTLPGSPPESVETEISKKIEDTVGTISGIEELRSTSTEGVSTVTIQFVLEKDVDVAAQEVRDKVSLVQRDLPEDVDPPTIQQFDPSQIPIVSLALSADRPIREITEYADKILRRQIEGANGVGSVKIFGGRGRQINVWLDAYKLRSYNLTVTDVTRALQTQNIEVPGGRIEQPDRTLTLRTRGRLQKVEDFSNIVLKAKSGAAILLSDVARIEDGMAEADTSTEISGKAAVQLQVLKQSGTNTLAVIDAVKERIEVIQESKPKSYTLQIVRDESGFIEAAVHSVEEHLIVGSILAALVVLVFLWNWRSTLISAIAIPTSIIATFTLINYMGFTLNLITLLALTLSVGIVIDDAIVVLENIYRNIEEKGLTPFDAAIEGTREIGLAVLATTLSLVAVFLPVAFMSGIVGRFMNSFGVTMSFAILISLLVAFVLTPMLSSRWLKAPAGAGHGAEGGHTSSKDRGFYAIIDRVYTAMLKWSMGHRWAIVLLCGAVLYSVVPLMGSGAIPFNFLPEDDESQLQVAIEMPLGTSLEATTQAGRRIANSLKSQPEVDYTVLTAGDGGLNQATIYVRMKELKKRTVSQQAFMETVRTKIMVPFDEQGVLFSVQEVSSFGGGGGRRGNAKIQYVMSGPDLNVLRQAADKAVPEIRKIKGVSDAETSFVTGQPEVSLDINRQLAQQLGVQPADIAGALRYFVGGDKVTDFNQGGEQYEVHVRAEQKFRTTDEGISLLSVPSATLGSVPLDEVVTFENSSGPTSIERLNRQRQITLLANTLPGASEATIGAEIQKIVQGLGLGPDYKVAPVGTAKEQAKAFVAFLVAVGMSLIFMYLVLAAQFESWLHPITILLSLPLTVPFAMYALVIFQQSINIFSMLGILVLFGVVKKNAILQIDHTNQLREKGMNRYDAIILANRDRLRPILMTTIAFCMGMLPLVVSTGIGSGTNRAIGSVIFGGQVMSLLLTLLATPVAYSLFDDLSNFMTRIRQRVFGRNTTRLATSPLAMSKDNSDS